MFESIKKAMKSTFACEPGVSLEIQEHMSKYYPELVAKEKQFKATGAMSWKHAWADFDTTGHVDPLCDRLLYLVEGKKLTPKRVYRIDKITKRRQDSSASAMISDIGAAYSLDKIKREYPIYALARDEERVMLFRWIP